MTKKEVQDLYREAIYQHLLREGMHPLKAEMETNRRMRRDDAL